MLLRAAWWLETAREDVRCALSNRGALPGWHRWFLQRARHAAATARKLLSLWRAATLPAA